MVKIEDEAARVRVRKMISRDAATTQAISLRIIGSLIAMVALFWTIHTAYKLATEPTRHAAYSHWAFPVGALTMLFGFLFLILGIPILAGLFLDLSDQLQQTKENGIHQVNLTEEHNAAARETKTICKVIARISVTVITMIMLLWAIYTGFRLTTEPTRDSKYYALTISIGVVTIVFGLIYFIIGLAVMAEMIRDLPCQLRWKEKKGASIHQVNMISSSLFRK